MEPNQDSQARDAYQRDVDRRTQAGEQTDGRQFDDLSEAEKDQWRNRATGAAERQQ